MQQYMHANRSASVPVVALSMSVARFTAPDLEKVIQGVYGWMCSAKRCQDLSMTSNPQSCHKLAEKIQHGGDGRASVTELAFTEV
jgi:hypothetical protein